MSAPLVSILISTFNRSKLLRRAVSSVLMQDFTDFELVIIDDCSADDTSTVVGSIKDARIRYFRNDSNIGAHLGDRAHVRRFVYDLMRGKYFVYLCDDDYWISPTLLGREVALLERHTNVAFVTGGQLSYYLTTPESYFGCEPPNTITFNEENIGDVIDLKTLKCKSPHVGFLPRLYPKMVMTSEEYLNEFAAEPTTKCRITGSVLYSRSHFVRAGAMKSESGSQWQAGYEFWMGPACFGDVIYLDEPSVVVETRAANASFQRTQVDHYLDSVVSIEAAFANAMVDGELQSKRSFLHKIKATTIRNLGRAYLGNTITIRREGQLGLCSPENIAVPVTYRHILHCLRRNGALGSLTLKDLNQMITAEFPNGPGRRLEGAAIGALQRLRRFAAEVQQRLKA